MQSSTIHTINSGTSPDPVVTDPPWRRRYLQTSWVCRLSRPQNCLNEHQNRVKGRNDSQDLAVEGKLDNNSLHSAQSLNDTFFLSTVVSTTWFKCVHQSVCVSSASTLYLSSTVFVCVFFFFATMKQLMPDTRVWKTSFYPQQDNDLLSLGGKQTYKNLTLGNVSSTVWLSLAKDRLEYSPKNTLPSLKAR